MVIQYRQCPLAYHSVKTILLYVKAITCPQQLFTVPNSQTLCILWTFYLKSTKSNLIRYQLTIDSSQSPYLDTNHVNLSPTVAVYATSGRTMHFMAPNEPCWKWVRSNNMFDVNKISHSKIRIFLLMNTLRPRQHCRHFPTDIFKCVPLNENT